MHIIEIKKKYNSGITRVHHIVYYEVDYDADKIEKLVSDWCKQTSITDKYSYTWDLVRDLNIQNYVLNTELGKIEKLVSQLSEKSQNIKKYRDLHGI